MRVRVILNPWSDQGQAIRHKEHIERVGIKYGEIEIVLTERPGHGIELARQAADSGVDLVVAAGGDGTIHEVVNGLMQSASNDTKLGVIPIGTGNDLAFALGIPLDDVAAAVDRLFSGTVRSIDLGRVEDDQGRYRYFDNNLGIGTDAIVVIRSQAITRLRGFTLYVAAVLQTILFYYRTLKLDISFDKERISQESLLLALGVGPRGGGGFFLTPDANHHDDLLDSCIATPVSRFNMIRLVALSVKGKHVDSKHVTMRKNKRITVRSDQPMPIHVDGEVFAYPWDNVRHVVISSVAAAIQVMA